MKNGNELHKKQWIKPTINRLKFNQTLGGPPPDELEDGYGSGSILIGS